MAKLFAMRVVVAFLVVGLSGPVQAGIMLGTPEGGIPNDVTLPVSSTSVGAVGVNAYTGWTNPADTAANDNQWTTPTTNIRYLYPTDSKYPIATTVGQWRDFEVTTWARNGCVLARWSGTTAIYFVHNGDTANGALGVGVATGINPGGSQVSACPNAASTSDLYTNLNLVGTVAGYSKTDTAGDTFTFGCAGWECYAEFNGVEFWRSEPDIRWPMSAGAVALSNVPGYGFRDTSVHWLPLTPIYSNPTVALYDMRDFGIKSVETTGSITSGSDELTVADASGFAVGDDIIVECGTEAGACALATVGVGGTWPAAHYANDAAMDAAVPCTALSFAYLEDSNKVRQCSNDGSAWYPWASNLYFTNTKVPRALAATITGVAGSVLTLDATASATATNAGVYYDSSATMAAIFADNVSNSAIFPIGTYQFPENTVIAGGFALYLRDGTSLNDGPKIVGAGLDKDTPIYTFYAPDGSPGITLTPYIVDYATVQDVYIRNNGGLEKFGLDWTTNGTQGRVYPAGITLGINAYGLVVDSGAENSIGSAVGCSFCYETNFIRPYARVTYRSPLYIGNWKITQADSTGGSIVDGEVDSDWSINGFELFRNDGGQLIRPVGRNASLAMNSSGGGWLIEDAYLVFEQDKDSPGISPFSPLMDINSNIHPPNPSMLAGGAITNPTIIYNYYNTANDLPVAITINENNPNITVSGTYPTCTSPKGLVQHPGWFSGTNSFWGIGVRTSGDNTVISGMRFDGDADYSDGHGNIHTEGGSGKSVIVTNNVMDHAATGNSVIAETGTISNATYEGMCP